MQPTDSPLPAPSPSRLPEPITVPLKRAPLWSSGLTILCTLAVAYTLSAAIDVLPGVWKGTASTSEAYDFIAVLVLLGGIFIALLVKRWVVRLRPLQPIAFHEAHMTLPRHGEAISSRTVTYAEIMSVNEGGRAPKRHFFIESKRHVFHLTQEMFRDADGPDRLFFELRRRILALPQGAQLIEQTERRRLVALRAMMLRPLWTQAILGVVAVFYLNTYFKGAFDTPLGLVRWGANVPTLVRSGEWYRLIAANFLHGGWYNGVIHVFMNGTALYYLGNLLERLLGWPRFLLIYLLSGIVAMGASTLLNDAVMSIGASGAVFGLLGGFAIVSWRLRSQLPLGLRQPGRWWLFMLSINALVPLLWPMVDVTAHVAGFVFGALLTALLLGRAKRLPERAGPILMATAVAAVAVYAAGLATAVYHAARTGTDSDARFIDAMVQSPHASPAALNDLALVLAINRQTPDDALQSAQVAIDKALAQLPDNPVYLNTAAVLSARLGNLDRAVAHERRAIALAGDDPLLASQLAHLLAARLKRSDAPRQPAMAETPIALRLDADNNTLRLDSAPSSCEIYGLLKRADHPIGLVHILVGPDFHTTSVFDTRLYRPTRGDTAWTLELAWAAPAVHDVASDTAQWTITPVLELTY